MHSMTRRRSDSDSGDSGAPSAPKQQKLDTMLSSKVKYNANMVTQAQVDNLLIKFMTEAVMPFSLVEQPAFKEFVLSQIDQLCAELQWYGKSMTKPV